MGNLADALKEERRGYDLETTIRIALQLVWEVHETAEQETRFDADSGFPLVMAIETAYNALGEVRRRVEARRELGDD